MTRQWREELDRILRASPDRDNTELIRELHEFAAAIGPRDGEALIEANPGFLAYRPALYRARCEMVVRNEISQARQFLDRDLNGSTPFAAVANPFLAHVYCRSGDMFDHVDPNGCTRMVLVGCGWMPATLFYVHDKTDMPELVGLDVAPEAIEIANELARRLGYVRVRAELEDGRSYDYGGADIVYIVGMVSQKSTVLARIAGTAPEDVQVLVNEPYSIGRLWHEAVEPSLDPRFEILARGAERATGRDLIVRRRPTEAGHNSRPNA
jgi:hypothetical protein